MYCIMAYMKFAAEEFTVNFLLFLDGSNCFWLVLMVSSRFSLVHIVFILLSLNSRTVPREELSILYLFSPHCYTDANVRAVSPPLLPAIAGDEGWSCDWWWCSGHKSHSYRLSLQIWSPCLPQEASLINMGGCRASVTTRRFITQTEQKTLRIP